MTDTSPHLTPEAVTSGLTGVVKPGYTVTVQVFLHDSVKPAEIKLIATDVVAQANQLAGLTTGGAVVGRVSKMAKSFSVSSDQPAFFSYLVRQPGVKSLLEARQTNIFPRPFVKSGASS